MSKLLPAFICLSLTLLACGVLACGGSDNSELTTEVDKLRDEVRALKQVKYDVESLEGELAELKKQFAAQTKTEQPRADRSLPIYEISFKPNGSHLDDPFLGPEDAPVIMMNFTDYQCDSCRKFATNSLPKVKEEFIAQNKLRFILRDFPLDTNANSLQASMFAHCAGEQGQYWQAHDLLFAEAGPVRAGDFGALAERLQGIELRKLKSCLESKRYEVEASKDTAEAKSLGAQGVPGFFVGKPAADGALHGVVIRGAQPLALIRAEVLKQLEH